MNEPEQTRSRFGWAWLALHVTDEALTGFLSVYNAAVRTIRGQKVPGPQLKPTLRLSPDTG
jgi:hypothetical protein